MGWEAALPQGVGAELWTRRKLKFYLPKLFLKSMTTQECDIPGRDR